MAFLLKKNYDHVSVDNDYDDDITSCIMRKLKKPTGKECVNICMKVVGTLAGQALSTLHNSLFFFERAVEENWVQTLGEYFSSEPHSFVVLECLARFTHPTLERNHPLTYKARGVFNELRCQAATVLLRRGFIG